MKGILVKDVLFYCEVGFSMNGGGNLSNAFS